MLKCYMKILLEIFHKSKKTKIMKMCENLKRNIKQDVFTYKMIIWMWNFQGQFWELWTVINKVDNY
jgi:ribosomal protein L30E